jgi:DNA-3-methyladenine glycosylase II
MQTIVNSRDMTRLLGKDATFSKIRKQYGPPPDWRREVGFVSLSRIILEQQVSLESAAAHFAKLDAYLEAFEPAEILRLTDEEMRACQISRQKAVYLRALSEAVLAGELVFEELERADEDEVRRRLTRIKGIGDWTANIYLMFCLRRKDIFPHGDIAVENTVRELYGLESREEVAAISERWKPLRSLAAYFFWHYYLQRRNRSGA